MTAKAPSTPIRRLIACAVVGPLAAAMLGGTIMAIWFNPFRDSDGRSSHPDVGSQESLPPGEDNAFALQRRQMVQNQLRSRDITDAVVLKAMGHVAREEFVPARVREEAYEDHPLPIGLGQTISQPYIVALMTQLARPTPECRALEVGVGSGYQAAILAELCKEVYGIEIICTLADAARERLNAMGYNNVAIRCADGYRGWPEHAPFDLIVVSAAPDHVPEPLIDQLAPGGRLVIPVGAGPQELLLIEKRPDGSLVRHNEAPVQFVPMTGEAQQ
jgi:protein-L-isoaspartate(D-aspartate) O-methyltransferase